MKRISHRELEPILAKMLSNLSSADLEKCITETKEFCHSLESTSTYTTEG